VTKCRLIPSVAIVLLLMSVAAPGVGTDLNISKADVMSGMHHTAQYIVRGPLRIDGNDELEEIASSGTGVEGDPYIITGLRVEGNGRDACITVFNTTAFFVIRDCIVTSSSEENSTHGIVFDSIVNGAIDGCQISSGLLTGVTLQNCIDCMVNDTRVYDVEEIGVHLSASSDCIIKGNRIYANRKGIMAEATDTCTVINNTIYRNSIEGIDFAFNAQFNVVYGNSIGWNGVGASGVAENQFNARNDGSGNRFDDGVSIGNRWSDYNASEPYMIDGVQQVVDEYALLFEDLTNPFINSPMDIAVDMESNGNMLTWACVDETPYLYTLFLNGASELIGIWDSGPVTINIDHLTAGTHNATLEILDAAGNRATDTVFVTVISLVFGGMGTDLVMIASGVTVVVFLTLLLLAKKVL